MEKKYFVLILLTLFFISVRGQNNACFEYITSDEKLLSVDGQNFKDSNGNPLTVISNTYENGKGILEFSGEVCEICRDALSYKKNLLSLTIPAAVSKIANVAFRGCPNLYVIKVSPYNQTYDSRDNSNAIINSSTNVLVVGCKGTIIPEGVTAIGSNAFDRSGITDVIFPSTLTTIERDAFFGCSSLNSIFLSKNVSNINGPNPFRYCENLSKIIVDEGNDVYDSRNNCNAIIMKSTNELVIGCKGTTIPSSVTSIGSFAFDGMQMETITIPQSVKIIKSDVFQSTAFSAIICLATTPPEFMPGNNTNAKLFVLENCITIYSLTDGWRDFTNILPIGGDEYFASFDNALYVENTDVQTNREATLSLKMKNNAPITGFQCDVVMPEGMSIAMEDDEFYMIDLSTERTTAQKTNTFDSALQPDGTVRILCGSTKNYTFSGNDGEVATIKINVADDVKGGEYFVLLKNVVMSDASGKTYKTDYVVSVLTVNEFMLGDANDDTEVNIGDYTTIANHILGNDGPVFVEKAADVNCDNEINVGDLTAVANLILYGSSSGQNAKSIMHKASTDPAGYDNLIYIASESMKAGEAKDFSVQMKNAVPMTGFQFDIEMPEGITVDMDDDFYCISLSTERTTARKTNTFDSALQPDGTVRVLCGSTKSYTFDGSDGEVAVISVKAADDVKPGNYTMKLKNIVMSDATGKTYKVDCSDVAITVTGTTGITSISGNEVMNDGKYIINNRFVIKRGDRMYNALGELVK